MTSTGYPGPKKLLARSGPEGRKGSNAQVYMLMPGRASPGSPSSHSSSPTAGGGAAAEDTQARHAQPSHLWPTEWAVPPSPSAPTACLSNQALSTPNCPSTRHNLQVVMSLLLDHDLLPPGPNITAKSCVNITIIQAGLEISTTAISTRTSLIQIRLVESV